MVQILCEVNRWTQIRLAPASISRVQGTRFQVGLAVLILYKVSSGFSCFDLVFFGFRVSGALLFSGFGSVSRRFEV